MKIYLISSEINNETLYKIGVTKRNINNRLKELKVGNAANLSVINFFESKWAFKIESNLHMRFSSVNVNGEWFALTPDIVLNFNKICKEINDNFELLASTNTWYIDRILKEK